MTGLQDATPTARLRPVAALHRNRRLLRPAHPATRSSGDGCDDAGRRQSRQLPPSGRNPGPAATQTELAPQSVIGDGPQRAEVQAMFARPASGVASHGWASKPAPQIAATLALASAYIWPGCGEAYGLAYLEAQAAGVPVIAQRIAGVPEVVADGRNRFSDRTRRRRAAAAQPSRACLAIPPCNTAWAKPRASALCAITP